MIPSAAMMPLFLPFTTRCVPKPVSPISPPETIALPESRSPPPAPSRKKGSNREREKRLESRWDTHGKAPAAGARHPDRCLIALVDRRTVVLNGGLLETCIGVPDRGP